MHDAEALRVQDERIQWAEAALRKAEALVEAAGDKADQPVKQPPPAEEGQPSQAVADSSATGVDAAVVAAEGKEGTGDVEMGQDLEAGPPAVMPYIEPPTICVEGDAETQARLVQLVHVMSHWRQQGVTFPLSLNALGMSPQQLAALVGPTAWGEFYAGEAVPAPDAPLDRRLLGVLDTALINSLIRLKVDAASAQAASQAARETVRGAAEAYSKEASRRKMGSGNLATLRRTVGK